MAKPAWDQLKEKRPGVENVSGSYLWFIPNFCPEDFEVGGKYGKNGCEASGLKRHEKYNRKKCEECWLNETER